MGNNQVTHNDAVFGRVIVNLRQKQGLDQLSLSAKLEINQPALSRLERGESSANISTIVNLAKALNTKPSELIEEFDRSIQRLNQHGVKIVPKKETSTGLVLALISVAVLAAIISK